MKKNKINVGFVLNYSYHTWIGGYNYHLSLFKCLKKFNNKVNIIIFVNKNISKYDQNLLKEYKIIKTDRFNHSSFAIRVDKILSKFKILLKGKDNKLDQFFKKYKIDIVSHFTYLGKKSLIRSIPIIWDFQELYNKKNFRYSDIVLRKINSIMCNKHSDKVILGSNHTFNDYSKVLNKKINNGVIINQAYFFNLKIKKKIPLLKKYNIANKSFFLLPNQYWRHKNHIVLLKALKYLNDINKKNNFLVISTGNTKNWRDAKYFKEILDFIKTNKINNYKILGIINHDDLINLAYYCKGIVNPSISEGWSNSVELANSLDKINIISNIKCHKEQSNDKSFLFHPNDYKKLAYLLIKKYKYSVLNNKQLQKKIDKNAFSFSEKYFQTVYEIIKAKNIINISENS